MQGLKMKNNRTGCTFQEDCSTNFVESSDTDKNLGEVIVIVEISASKIIYIKY